MSATRWFVFWGLMMRLEFKPRDLWVGAYFTGDGEAWFCLLPCFPLHILKVPHA